MYLCYTTCCISNGITFCVAKQCFLGNIVKWNIHKSVEGKGLNKYPAAYIRIPFHVYITKQISVRKSPQLFAHICILHTLNAFSSSYSHTKTI